MMKKKDPGIYALSSIGKNLSLKDFDKIKIEYFKMKTLYQAAIREVSTKLEILDDEFQISHKRNPIHHIQSRLKSPESIYEKLNRKGFEISMESARENLTDIAGIRVVCSYIQDVYIIARLLKSQDDISLLRQTDYIKNPKPNGYRSLHLVITVPIFLSTKKEFVPVEIQIRTIGMDLWASLEHQLYYKAGKKAPSFIIKDLKECASILSTLDLKMQDIYNAVEEFETVDFSS